MEELHKPLAVLLLRIFIILYKAMYPE